MSPRATKEQLEYRQKLIPPDVNQCQAEKPNGQSFMTLGGKAGWVRCTEVPAWIARERAPGKDGRVGEMSLCTACRQVMLGQLGPKFATFRPIPRYAVRVRVEVVQLAPASREPGHAGGQPKPLVLEVREQEIKNLTHSGMALEISKELVTKALPSLALKQAKQSK